MENFETKKIEIRNRQLNDDNRKLREKIAELSNEILQISAELVQCQLSLRIKTVECNALHTAIESREMRDMAS